MAVGGTAVAVAAGMAVGAGADVAAGAAVGAGAVVAAGAAVGAGLDVGSGSPPPQATATKAPTTKIVRTRLRQPNRLVNILSFLPVLRASGKCTQNTAFRISRPESTD